MLETVSVLRSYCIGVLGGLGPVVQGPGKGEETVRVRLEPPRAPHQDLVSDSARLPGFRHSRVQAPAAATGAAGGATPPIEHATAAGATQVAR